MIPRSVLPDEARSGQIQGESRAVLPRLEFNKRALGGTAPPPQQNSLPQRQAVRLLPPRRRRRKRRRVLASVQSGVRQAAKEPASGFHALQPRRPSFQRPVSSVELWRPTGR